MGWVGIDRRMTIYKFKNYAHFVHSAFDGICNVSVCTHTRTQLNAEQHLHGESNKWRENTLSTWMNRSICVVEIMNYLNHNITYDCLKIITAENCRKEIKKRRKKKTIPRTKRFLEMDMLIAYGRLNFIENVSKWLFINSQLWMCRLMRHERCECARSKDEKAEKNWSAGNGIAERRREHSQTKSELSLNTTKLRNNSSHHFICGI